MEPMNPQHVDNEAFMSEDESSPVHRQGETKPTAPVREVIREEDLPQEDRDVLDTDKVDQQVTERARMAPVKATEPLSAKISVRDVVAKQEYIEENDGVTIKGVVERPTRSEDISGLSTSVPASPSSAAIKPAVAESKEDSPSRQAIDEVLIDLVTPNPNQPRMHFNQEELEELSSSIEKDGLLQPILVREVGNGYEIIAGERRWQACKLAGLKTVPVRIKEADDMKVLELALIENLQRSDLNPIEEAYGYKRMMERGNKTQSEVASAVSKGRSTIANALRLLDLPEEAQQLLYEEKITAGHARAILSIPSKEGRRKLTDKLMHEKLSVREAEALARLIAGREQSKNQDKKTPAPKFFKTAARELGDTLGAKVRIRSLNGKNKIEIEFKDEDELHRLFDLMSREK